MVRIEGNKIVLRSVDMSDIDTLLLWENSRSEPLYGIFEEQYTREDVVRFVEYQQRYPISDTEQLRLMICLPDGERIGAIDLTDYDGERAFVSIIIADRRRRGCGYGTEALRLTVDYAKSIGVVELRAKILSENKISRQMFSSVGFVGIGAELFALRLI